MHAEWMKTGGRWLQAYWKESGGDDGIKLMIALIAIASDGAQIFGGERSEEG